MLTGSVSTMANLLSTFFSKKKKFFAKSAIWGMIWAGNLILRTMVLEYFNKSLYFKSYMSFLVKIGFYPDTKKSAENGHFLQFRTALISQFFTPPLVANPWY